MKVSMMIKAALTASLFMILSGPIQACEVSGEKYFDTESIKSEVLTCLHDELNEE